jgi:flagellum-specific ATP synthase
MPKLLERSGTSDRGTITGFYTILVDADDMDEPVADNVRGILDGHLVLSRRLAQAYHYPALDILGSVSRLAPVISGPVTKKAVGYILRLMAVYAEAEDLINVGAYHAGSNPTIDEAIAQKKAIDDFLIQTVDEKSSVAETLSALAEIAHMEIPVEETEVYKKSSPTGGVFTKTLRSPGFDVPPQGNSE